MDGADSSNHGTGKSSQDRVMTALLSIASDPELDPARAELMTRRLRAELAELDVEWVRPAPAGTVPDGAKGADAVTVGAVIVALSASGGVFTALIETVRDWLGRQSGRHRVSLTVDGDSIELELASADERRQLVDAYVRRHTGG